MSRSTFFGDSCNFIAFSLKSIPVSPVLYYTEFTRHIVLLGFIRLGGMAVLTYDLQEVASAKGKLKNEVSGLYD
ncbi:hypothetical protein [Paenibacillus agilis]|uniref:Uncharacterized protein n=1 Tax=Paenibacillus agilis TaxID=3020863 RepID=A0A559J0Q7_9BACL|nr:hypothetical protein [Paenibacillus agilis]TVX93464.1 hypothetical protein FPZ44_10605 [Paenibacillus agilis]